MRARLLLPLAVAAAVIACDDLGLDGLDDDSSTVVRVLHASPDAPIMDAILNIAIIAPQLHYLDLSEYVGVQVNQHTFEFRKTDVSLPMDGRLLAHTNLSVVANQRYTILAVDSFADQLVGSDRFSTRRQGVEPLTLIDDPTAPPALSARLRFVQAAPSTLVADVYITSPNADINTATPTFRDLTFKAVATYITLPSGVYQVRATIAGTKTVILNVNPFVLAVGQVQTAVMLDGPGGGTPSILRRLNDRAVLLEN